MVNFFNSLNTYLAFISNILLIIVAIRILISLVNYTKGLTPVVINLAKGLVKKKVAIISNVEEGRVIANVLTDTKLIKNKNISTFQYDDLESLPSFHIIIVKWNDVKKDNLLKIIDKKGNHQGLIVYAPYSEGKIDPDTMDKINEKRNCSVTNFKGRLFSDVLVNLISIAFVK